MASFNNLILSTITPPPLPPRKRDLENILSRVPVALQIFTDMNTRLETCSDFTKNELLEIKAQKVKLLSQAPNIEKKHLAFEDIRQQLLGNFSSLIPEVINRILSSLPIQTDRSELPLPGEIDKCINIMKLFGKAQLGEKAIRGTIHPKIFTQWMNTQRIPFHWLAFNLSEEDEAAMQPHLEYLKISPCDEITWRYEVIPFFFNLKTLIIKDVSQEKLQHVRKLTNLTSVHLRYFSTSCSMDFTVFENCKNLKSLNVQYWSNSLQTDEIWRGLASLHQLEELAINPYISGLKHIPQLSNLKKLKLYVVADVTSNEELNECIGTLKNLEDLFICNWRPKDKEFLPILGSLPRLIKLTFKNVCLTDEAMRSINKAKNLKTLQFNHCPNKLSEKGLEYLHSLKKMKTLGCQEIRFKT